MLYTTAHHWRWSLTFADCVALPCEIDFLKRTEELQEHTGDSGFINISLCPKGGTSSGRSKLGGKVRRSSILCGEGEIFSCWRSDITVWIRQGSGWRTVDWVRAKQERQGISRYFEDFKSHIAVSSCIFGAWDNLRTPTNRKISFDSRVRYLLLFLVTLCFSRFS